MKITQFRPNSGISSKDVFDELSKDLGVLSDKVYNAYLDATAESILEEGRRLEHNLDKGHKELARHKISTGLVKGKYSYSYSVDWSDELVSNNYGRDRDKPRRKGKRNYSIAPASWHDLAYIINTGTTSEDGKTIRAGTHFITKAWRNAKKWKKKQEIYFNAKCDKLKLENDKGDN